LKRRLQTVRRTLKLETASPELSLVRPGGRCGAF
jgi:hypothetical protein